MKKRIKKILLDDDFSWAKESTENIVKSQKDIVYFSRAINHKAHLRSKKINDIEKKVDRMVANTNKLSVIQTDQRAITTCVIGLKDRIIDLPVQSKNTYMTMEEAIKSENIFDKYIIIPEKVSFVNEKIDLRLITSKKDFIQYILNDEYNILKGEGIYKQGSLEGFKDNSIFMLNNNGFRKFVNNNSDFKLEEEDVHVIKKNCTLNTDILSPAISLIVPVYNRMEHLEECIKSVIQQKKINFDNFELILIDDKSTDQSYEIMKKYENLSFVQVYQNPVNMGPGATRNFGISKAKNDYVTFLDSDDLINEELLYNYWKFVETGCDYDVIGTKLMIYNSENNHKTWNLSRQSESFKANYNNVLLYNKDILIEDTSACTKLFKKEILIKHPFESNLYYEDNYISCILYDKRICLMDYEGYYYRKDGQESITNSVYSNIEKKTSDLIKIIKIQYDFYTSGLCSEEFIKKQLNKQLQHRVYLFLKHYMQYSRKNIYQAAAVFSEELNEVSHILVELEIDLNELFFIKYNLTSAELNELSKKMYDKQFIVRNGKFIAELENGKEIEVPSNKAVTTAVKSNYKEVYIHANNIVDLANTENNLIFDECYILRVSKNIHNVNIAYEQEGVIYVKNINC